MGKLDESRVDDLALYSKKKKNQDGDTSGLWLVHVNKKFGN